MQVVILMGIQATGKSTFYQQHLFRTHVRINLDMLRTRRREAILFEACLRAKQRLVVDNTNVTRADRRRYIEPARAAGFEVVGYYFRSSLPEALARNAARPPAERVPEVGVRAALGRLEPPAPEEGFDRLYTVRIGQGGEFIIEPWPGEE